MTGYMKSIFPIFTGWNFIINYFHCDVYQITLTHSPTEFKLKLKIKSNPFGIFSSYFEKKLFHISFPELQEKSEALDCKMLYCKPNVKLLSKYKFRYSGNCNNKNCSRSQTSIKVFKKIMVSFFACCDFLFPKVSLLFKKWQMSTFRGGLETEH